MSDRSPLDDPQPDALARRLAAARPQLEAEERDALLYACGFAAGRQSASGVAWRWRAVAASLALVAAGLGVQSSQNRTGPAGTEAVGTPESAVVESANPRASRAETASVEAASAETGPQMPRRDRRRPGVLLANSSWEQVRASFESPPDKVEIPSVPDSPSRRSVLRAGSAWNEPGLEK